MMLMYSARNPTTRQDHNPPLRHGLETCAGAGEPDRAQHLPRHSEPDRKLLAGRALGIWSSRRWMVPAPTPCLRSPSHHLLGVDKYVFTFLSLSFSITRHKERTCTWRS